MSDEEKAPSFLEDARVKFIEVKLCDLLQVRSKTWEKSAVSEEFQMLLKDFFERGSVVFFSSSTKGCLVASHEVPAVAYNKQVCILKKTAVPVNFENYRRLLLFGSLSTTPLTQLSCTVEQLCVPLLTNCKNHHMMPNLMPEDIIRHVEKVRSKTSVVHGKALGKTVLPIPTAVDWMEKSHKTLKIGHDGYDRALAHAIETQVISWSNTIQKILKEDSADLLATGCNPGPKAELKFWASRKKNIQSIYHQLQSPIVEMMAKMLEIMDSSYQTTIKTLLVNVFTALQEAQDIDLYLRPLSAQLSQLEKKGLLYMEAYIPALFHTLFLIWTNCQSYQRPGRIVVLLQEICNLFIEHASAYLSADLLLREDPEESLLMVKRGIKVFSCFKESYQTQRMRLANQENHAPWDFPSTMILSRFSSFFNRMLQLEDLFEIMLDFQRMEKLEFGGIKGGLYNNYVSKIHREFREHCQELKHSKNSPLDITSQAFEDEYYAFRSKVADMECRLASLLSLALKDCTGLESALKMLTIVGPFLEKKEIRRRLFPSLILLQQLFKQELMNCDGLFQSHCKQVESGLTKNMAHTSGSLKWAKMLRERINTPLQRFGLLFDMSAEGMEMMNDCQLYNEMLGLLNQYEEDVYSEWCNGLEQACLINLNQPLIKRNHTTGLISVNFNTKWYNKLKLTVLEVELPLIKAELESINLQLLRAETDLTWQDQQSWNLIRTTKHFVQDLACRVSRAKENCDAIQAVMKGWSKQVMFCRKDNKKGSFIQLGDRTDCVSKKYNSMRKDGDFIHQLVQENMSLFRAEPASEGWRSYLEYMDDVVVEGLFSYISHSLQFFVDNMELLPNQAPLFEAQLMLDDTGVTSCPSVERDVGDGLYDLIEELVANVFKTSLNVKRVAESHLIMESYQDVMDGMADLLDLRQEIMGRVDNVLKKASEYQRTFDIYAHLWQDDRTEFLSHFLQYGRVLSTEEMEASKADLLPKNPPSIDNFKEQSSVENWTMTKWRQTNIDQMDAELRRFAKDIRKLDKDARMWDVYSGLDRFVKNLLTSLRAVLLQSVFLSKHVDHFFFQAVELQNQLTVADTVLMVWMEVQRTWTYLESIFKGCDDIGQQLPTDTHRFQAIDAEFQELMLDSAKTKNVIEATNKPHLFEKLEDLQKRLALCEKALAEYLETKRISFPRFYFLSSTDLLDILSKGSRPSEVIVHLLKLFDNMSDLEFAKNDQMDNPKYAVGMYSREREHVPFQTECCCYGLVETWLASLEESMRKCIRGHLLEAVSVYEDRSREQWILEFPAQVALTGSQIWWSNDMELVFKRLEEGLESALKDYNKKQISQLNLLIGLLLGELSPEDRRKVMTVCTIDVHARDIVASLIAHKVTNSQAFQWLSQLRHCWNEKDHHCYINICDAQFRYLYEYLGNAPRLVITPLTDRCYITLTQSLHLMMSGAPAGPAGSGKTETTKDLGRAMGVMVYIFNCSEQMDYKSIGNIYKGLAQTGAWGCFDEFNRIPVDVLSVVAVQVKAIQDALRSKKKRFLFLDHDIALKNSVGIFITMNPGYAGRAELPENLKALFRPCAMVVPDTELICEIMLVAEGFHDAKVLARKFTALYRLCKELLSKQDHYDWGLRAVKSVLVLAGALRRRDKTRPENQVLMRALRDFNMPKIVTEDVSVFLGLLGDLFPGLEVERERNFEFEKAVKETMLELRLQPEDSFIFKVVQLEELMTVRHSVFVVGNAGTGKSQILRVLHKTYVNLRRKPVWNDLNPKAIDRNELFGFIHPATREWKDGLLSSLMREQANISHLGPKWIVLDGDIDPMWIESLNTVMDDNKVLTLASNERVPLTSSMRLVFEISHLMMATPATVSRAGILYVNQQDVGWNPYAASWIDQRERQTERAHLTILFEKYVPLCLEQMKNRFKTITPIPEISMVQTLCILLDCLLTPENIPSDSPREVYEIYFTFACIWAFGGALCHDQLHDYRVEFSQWWAKEMKTVKLPAQGTVFDYYLDHQTKRFLPWSDIVPQFELRSCTPLQAVLVHTAETVRLWYFMDLLLERRQPVMLVGNAGVGKTALVRSKLESLPESYMTSKVPFNYYTTSLMLQEILERPLEKRAGRCYSLIGNRKLIYFIDDMNIAAVDPYGTVQPHALIRQHLDYGHWYGRQKLALKEIQNTQYIACMNPTAGSFIINPRLQRHFSVFAVNLPSFEAQMSIYSQILCGHVKQQLFSPLVQRSIPAVVKAALKLNHKIVHNFLPTTIKFHYTFNLRDISNVFQGIILCPPENLKGNIDMALLWLHESCRVYSDRLVDVKDLELFQKLQMETLHECFEGVEEKKLKKQPLLFCHISHMDEDPSYTPVTDWSTLKTALTDALESYNELHPAMNLVLFEDAMQHVCRISRILEAPRGHGLLVGVGGSGKQSLTRLAAYMSSVEVFQISLTKGYSVQDLKTDLAGLFLKTGVKNQRVAFLLTDAQIPDEHFLVPINDLLASGEIPELFSEEDMEEIVSSVRAAVRGVGLLDNRENCWRFFIHRVVLCLSPLGTNLRVRARQFPALISCTAIDWFHPWTTKALQSVSNTFIQDIKCIEPAVQESISLFMAYVHTSVNQASEKYQRNEKRYNYTTPKSFLQQITLYRNLLEKSRSQLQHKMNRLDNGLQKLQTTAAQVEDLKAKLALQEAELNFKNKNIETLITKIGQQTERVSKKREAADMEAQKVSVIQAEITAKHKECESDLAKAEPSLTAAVAALNTLNKVNITELKAFPNPPAAVINVVAAVMVLLAPRGRVPKDRSWKATRAFMGKVDDFLQALVSYDKEHIAESCLAVVKQQYLRNPDFHPDLVWTKSTAAAGLCAWTINIVRYYEIYCEVTPKRQALLQANAELEMATSKFLAVQTKLADLDASLQSLTAQFERATAEKISCQEEVTRTTQTIELANRLVRGLVSERERWSQAIVQYENQRKTLCGDVLLTSAFVSYMGYFTSQYRTELFNNAWIPFLESQKVSVPLTDGLDPVLMLTDDATVAAWHNQGLPNDRMSTENAAILTTSERWPLIIDPQQQGIKWIRNLLGSQLRMIQMGQKGYLDVIEQALVCGDTVMIENLPEKVDPVLEPLLGRKTIKKGRYIFIGGKEFEYNRNFQLILHTKLANPHFPPELQAQTTLINFTVTPVGLEEQLLGRVVSYERPDLEAQKMQLTTQQNHFKIELKRFEDELLSHLSGAHGDFLGDISLVEQLENTKSMAAHIQTKVVEARENETKINEARELYRPAAERASLLFFIISDLSKMNPMYQFSLKSFISVFNKAIECAEWDEDVRTRVHTLTEAITYSVFLCTSQGLFERDKLTFLSHVAFQILLKQGLIDAQEFHFLLNFPVDTSKVSAVTFLSPHAWGAIKSISTMEDFNGLDRDMESSPKGWRKIVESSCPENERLPQDWKNKSSLQKLIILRALRPDRMTYALKMFVQENMGSKYVKPAHLEFEKLYEDSSPTTPVFFILSPGVDPLRDVEKLGLKLGFSIDQGTLHNVSLGQGQEEVAERALRNASKRGHWVIFQNVHLVARWLPSLEALLDTVAVNSHPSYRVFITGEPVQGPEQHIILRGILENAIKITNEPATGMNASLHAALNNLCQDTLEMCSREQDFSSMVFSLCFFHACVTERRKFGPQGWNQKYPFSTGDLTVSVNVLFNYLEANTKQSMQVPWEDLCYLFGEIIYGGHITDNWDRRLCKTYLQDLMHTKMFEAELSLCPGFPAPPFLDLTGYHSYINEFLPPENPTLYGLHPNAELGCLTVTSGNIFKTLLDLQPHDSIRGDGATQSMEEKVMSIVDDILEKLPDEYNVAEMMTKITERSPYTSVCFQECERMNLLIAEIKKSLTELNLGLKGELTISYTMETLQNAMFNHFVPDSWARLAFPSTKTLTLWLNDLICSCHELDSWTQDFVLPAVVWLSGLFNPQSFLTAVMQSIARKYQWPLDNMTLSVDVTKKMKDDFGHPPREGAYIHGLFMEGARWDTQSGVISEAILRDLTPAMPVLYVRAVPAQEQELRNTFECPVYRTKQRGPTYIWAFHLRTKQPPSKWIVAGAALLLSV
ncbi:unnamed protein product [Menidia menidia]|uniref:(Atlantic silverside) hypothetical protein n=1 Tax=Menidia menidia TaxID=238744 RepID=A0A8S4BT98_9TELE|nr:unnamed protein product [Menidia menidia]